ncbi:glycosyltransferase family 2 protein [Salinimicrobium tongyeongense]|uniref:Glycosyltransferase family 2 protein n=1 Tax=Salinimicrobium tongyeongense TaxID=2809707 RepID=A0ABY6NRU3_9FLAO|nr:glycosyltransferase family A protein [Salinimicrobium tongyeongense]UZH55630.1 glycosyltransferase family 2 protein [Salinimicrobium tongyeongense]
MKFGLIICTYQRSEAILNLLLSVREQTHYPDQILVIDGSLDDRTENVLQQQEFSRLEYFKVGKENRGLTRQRNFGISKLSPEIEIVFFLDDDVIISSKYFEEILGTYKNFPEALGVSGYTINETEWKAVEENYEPTSGEFMFDGWVRKEGSRFLLRRRFGLQPDEPPGYMPEFSHGYSAGFLPPSGKTYEVEMLMGGIASYRKQVFSEFRFSPFFEGYGLYEDADFSLRVSRKGKLYVNTAAKLEHYHDEAGRPNKFRYGKMVLRNGWYVWRLRHAKPSSKAILKWHGTSFLLTLVRLGNVFNTSKKKEALTESLGRIAGWWSLLLERPGTKFKNSVE